MPSVSVDKTKNKMFQNDPGVGTPKSGCMGPGDGVGREGPGSIGPLDLVDRCLTTIVPFPLSQFDSNAFIFTSSPLMQMEGYVDQVGVD